MEVTAALSPDNITDGTAAMEVINATTDGMPTVVNNYTTTTQPQLSTEFVTFFFVIRFIFCGFAIFGNALTIRAVVRFERLQTSTNFLICSLAVADMLGGILAPLTLAHQMLSDKPIFVPLCLIDRTLGLISAGANLYTILWIAIDRYTFIAHPLHYPMWVTSTKIYIIIGVTWVFVVTEMTTIFVLSHHLAIGVTCKFSVFLSKQAYWILLMPQVGTVSVLTVVFYVAISRIAYKQGKAIAVLNQPYDTYEATLNRQQKKIAKMMLTVLGTYFACYIPQVTAGIILGLSTNSFWLYVEKITILIYWANTWLNPLIYTWKSEDFRVAFRKILGLKPSNQVQPG